MKILLKKLVVVFGVAYFGLISAAYAGAGCCSLKSDKTASQETLSENSMATTDSSLPQTGTPAAKGL